MEEKKPLVYEDKKTGEILYGFSNHDIKKLSVAMWVMIVLFIVIIIMVGYSLYMIDHWNIISKYINHCVC